MTVEHDTRKTILVVDDTPDNLALMNGLLKSTYRVKIANSGKRALSIAVADPKPDLILLDVMMPEMDGYEVCRRLKSNQATVDIPVVFLTARSDQEDEHQGLELGAVDYISKPISPPIVLARVHNHLQLKRAADLLKNENSYLEAVVLQRTKEVRAIRDATIVALASLAETRDNETGDHIRRTQDYVKELAEALADHPRFIKVLTPEYIDLLYRSAPLHDIGKVGVPDSVLLKPGRLTAEEFEIMKTHAKLGHDALVKAEEVAGTSGEKGFLRVARNIALTHHERWDGSGYPQGLSGDDIPISGRLMAIADVYDAMISKRVYKDPMPHEVAVEEIRKGRGTQFDPDIADAFLRLEDRFRQIAARHAD